MAVTALASAPEYVVAVTVPVVLRFSLEKLIAPVPDVIIAPFKVI